MTNAVDWLSKEKRSDVSDYKNSDRFLVPIRFCVGTEGWLQWNGITPSAGSKLGRAEIVSEVVDLVLRLARENSRWGYDRIAGTLANLGHQISDQSVGNILKRHGIEPSPQRRENTSWKTFLKAHWDTLAATDFTNVEVWTPRGLVTFSLLFVIELKTRRVRFAGCVTPSDGGHSMKQMAKIPDRLRKRIFTRKNALDHGP